MRKHVLNKSDSDWAVQPRCLKFWIYEEDGVLLTALAWHADLCDLFGNLEDSFPCDLLHCLGLVGQVSYFEDRF